MQVYIPSTPVQTYHMLRRQVLRRMCHPLVVVSPKSLLRHPLAVSSLEELVNDTSLPVIGGTDELDPKGVKRVVIYPGKIYYDLLEQYRRSNQHDVAIICTGQLYPFLHKVMQEVLQQFAHAEGLVWCRGGLLNQSAWYYNQHHFRGVIPFGVSLRYANRLASILPTVGYMSTHQK